MNDNQYFILFACCIPVKGPLRSTICDLQRETYHFIPNGLYTILVRHRKKSLREIKQLYNHAFDAVIDEYFDFLIQHELGFWSDHCDEAFVPLDLTWDRPEAVTNAVIDVNEHSRHDFDQIAGQLDALRCKALQLRFFYRVSLATLDRVLACFAQSTLRCIHVVLEKTEEYTLPAVEKLGNAHFRLMQVILYGAEGSHIARARNNSLDILSIPAMLSSASHCGAINPSLFFVNYDLFTESQRYNNCLNRKIAVDVDGEIRNCPSMPESYGNIRDTSLAEALSDPDFRKKWHIAKDQVDVCKVCEFRYICTDCRAYTQNPDDAFSKPAKCQYDPYTATWRAEEAAANAQFGQWVHAEPVH